MIPSLWVYHGLNFMSTLSGEVQIHYDTDFPRLKGTRGNKSYYESKGNLQIFFDKHNIEKAEKMEFIANQSDKYYI